MCTLLTNGNLIWFYLCSISPIDYDRRLYHQTPHEVRKGIVALSLRVCTSDDNHSMYLLPSPPPRMNCFHTSFSSWIPWMKYTELNFWKFEIPDTKNDGLFFLKSLAISLIAVVYVHTDGPTSSTHSCTHKYSSSLWPCYSYKFFVFPVFSMLLFSLLPKRKSQKVIYTKVILHQLMIRLTMYLLVTVSRAVRWITSCYLTVIYVHFCSIADRKLKLLES